MEIYWLPLLTGVGKLRNSNKNFIFITVTVTNGGDALIKTYSQVAFAGGYERVFGI
jgi:hypothetical protein